MSDEDDPIRTAIDMGGGQCCDVSGVLRELGARGFAIVPIADARLRQAFRNADSLDWEHLFRMLPDSGHGKFWKAVLTEARAALAE